MDQRQRIAGFTLIEVRVVVVIIGLMASIVVPYAFGPAERARHEQATVDVSQIYGAAMSCRLKRGRWPHTLEELIAGRPPEITGYKSVPKDPWGNFYRVDPASRATSGRWSPTDLIVRRAVTMTFPRTRRMGIDVVCGPVMLAT